jgi:DNA-binding MarR family transcriptional regulator
MTVSPIVQESIDNVNQLPEKAEEGALDLVHTVMHLYRAKQYQVLRDGPHALTHMESKVLSYFQRHPRATQSDCARHSGRDKAQLARLITGLRERGLLDGEADEADRRNFRLSLTPAGVAIQQVLAEQAQKLNAEAVRGLSPEQNQQLLALLSQVRHNLESQP